jgi:alditol oxidase
MHTAEHNWAGNLRYSAARLHAPSTVAQLQELVAGCARLRALGSRHSFNQIADSTEDLVSLEHLDAVLELDPARRTVTVEGGIRYGQLAEQLERAGFALRNLASLPHISVAGACATATHGSGVGNANLATEVAALELVAADGRLVTLSRAEHGEQFAGAVVGLGGLGVVARLTLDIVPTYSVRQYVYESLPLAQLEANLDAILSQAYSVSLFTDWRGPQINQVWIKQRLDEAEAPEELFGARLAPGPRHPLDGMPSENCTEQLGSPGPWHERLPHFRMQFTPSSGEELQSEYFVPRRHALAAVQAIARMGEQVSALIQISELRTIKADDLWMSPCYGQDCLGIHFTWKQDWPALERLLPRIEEQLAPFEARPHWGKLFTMQPARVQSLYARLPDFRQLLNSYDPAGKFRNAFLERYIF